MPLLIQFGHSTSKSYDKALEIARTAPLYSYSEATGNTLTLGKSDLGLFLPLYHYLRNWKDVKITYNGKPANISNLYQVSYCEQRLGPKSPVYYCYNDPWPCQQLSFKWYQYGQFDNQGRFVIDKAELRTGLMEEIKDSYIDLCPVFDMDRLNNIIATVPAFIDPKADSKWKYKTDQMGNNIGVELAFGPLSFSIGLKLESEESIEMKKKIEDARTPEDLFR